MRKQINFILEVLFLISLPIAVEHWIRHFFNYPFGLGYIGIVAVWIIFIVAIRKKILILL